MRDSPVRWKREDVGGEAWIVAAALAAIVWGAAGCHAQLRTFARDAERVEVRTHRAGTPTVDLGVDEAAPETARGAVVARRAKIAGAAASLNLVRRLNEQFPPERVESLVGEELARRLEDPPFAAAEENREADGTLRLLVQRFGVVDSEEGPSFAVDLVVHLRSTASGEPIYSTSLECRQPTFQREFPNRVVRAATAVAYFRSLSDRALERSIERTFRVCTEKLVERLERHAN